MMGTAWSSRILRLAAVAGYGFVHVHSQKSNEQTTWWHFAEPYIAAMAADPDLYVPAEEPREPPQPQVPPQPEPDPAEEEKRRREADYALLKKEIDRVERKCRDYEATAMGTIDEAIATLEQYKNKVMECDEDDEEALENVVKEFEKVWSEANYPSRVAPEAKPAKDMLACVGKLGKAIDKVCPKEESWENATWDLKEHPIDRDALKEVIVNHLYRVGRFDIGDLYAESEGGELADVDENAPKPIPPERREAMKAPFVEMWNVTWQIEREGDLSGLKTWLERNGDALVNKYTGAPPRVEFLLRKLEYVRMLTGRGGDEGASGEEPDGKRARTEGNRGVGGCSSVDGAAAAVAYGKEHFEKFTRLRDSKEANEVRRLMAAAVYARVGLENSPYKDIERECREIGGVLNPYSFDPDLRKRMEETAKGTEEDLADFEEIGSAWW